MIYIYKCFKCARTLKTSTKFNLIICPADCDEMELIDVDPNGKILRPRISN